jgi:hypothetical protein
MVTGVVLIKDNKGGFDKLYVPFIEPWILNTPIPFRIWSYVGALRTPLRDITGCYIWYLSAEGPIWCYASAYIGHANGARRKYIGLLTKSYQGPSVQRWTVSLSHVTVTTLFPLQIVTVFLQSTWRNIGQKCQGRKWKLLSGPFTWTNERHSQLDSTGVTAALYTRISCSWECCSEIFSSGNCTARVFSTLHVLWHRNVWLHHSTIWLDLGC